MSGETESNVSGWTTDTLHTLMAIEIERVQNLIHDLLRERSEMIEAKFGIRDQRLDDIDRASEILSDTVNRTPTIVQTEIQHVRQLIDEKFRSVDNQFSERDVRTEQQAGASSQALAAALQAAKELVGAQGEASAAAAVKSETSFTKQIDQIGTIIQTLEKALDARITELKERIDRGEGTSNGAREVRVERRADNTVLIAVGSLVVAVIVAAFIIFATFHK